MAVCQTIRTRIGVSNFLLRSLTGKEDLTAFQHTDNSIDVYTLKKDSQPLSLEENTVLGMLNVGDSKVMLVGATLIQTEIIIRFWNVNNHLVSEDIENEGGLQSRYILKHNMDESIETHKLAAIDTHICLVLNNKHLVLLNVSNSKHLNVVLAVEISLHESMPITDIIFLHNLNLLYLCVAGESSVNVMLIENDNLSSKMVLPVNMKHSKGATISHLHKVTSSKCLIVDSIGHLFLFSLPDDVVSLKLPGSLGGHGICAVVTSSYEYNGMLAVCNNEHSVNLYSLADVFESAINKDSVVYVRPFRVLCSQFPVNSLTFVRQDQLVLASTVNQSLTFWGGFPMHQNDV